MNEDNKLADELIKKRLEEIAGEGNEFELNKKKYKGKGEGVEIEIEEDEESRKIMDAAGFNFDEFDSLSSIQKENIQEDVSTENHKNDIVDAVDVEGTDNEKISVHGVDDSIEDDKPSTKNKVAYEGRSNKDGIRDNKESIEQRMESIGISKDEVVDLILQLTDDGHIDEQILLFKGRVKAKLRSPKMVDSAAFIDMMDETQMKTSAKVEFYINMFSVASVLVKYNDTDLEKLEAQDRVKWIEENIPTAIYRALLPKVLKFHEKIELLSMEEVADFF
jgi:hypothetical protein